MRSLSIKLVAAALVLALAVTASAQRQGRGGRGGFGMGGQAGPGLLLNKSVQDELKLTDDQKSSLTKIQEAQRENMKKAFQGGGGDKEKAREAFQTVMQETNKAITKVVGTLSPEQQKRFKQIQVQVGGLAAFSTPELAKDLSLTDKQKEEIKGIADDVQKDVAEIFKDAQGDRERMTAARGKIEKVRQEATAKALKTLSSDQQAKYKELSGPKFDFKPDNPFGGRGGRGKNKNKNKDQ
ncbi:MAG TPA: Spy/CpxP family protein refolding chaperone [Gemmataceae bacterium]|jgi:Spy/CpxP family protein refolding chaperone|nr:Spy/CpxP family protein refolding chaperone [Gemmataceae bacterium]